MPKTSTSNNIENVRYKVQVYDKGDPGTGFAQTGVNVSGFYWVDENEVIHYAGQGSGGSGGAEELGDLSDVSDATPTDRNLLIANGTDWASDVLVVDDIPQLTAVNLNFIGVKVGASGVDIEDELTNYDVNTFNEEYDTSGYFGVDSETITIPNDLGGYYLVIVDFRQTIDSGSTPLSFFVHMYLNGVSYDDWQVDCFNLYPTRMTWTFIANFLQSDDLTFKLSKEGGTEGASDEGNLNVTLQFIGKAP